MAINEKKQSFNENNINNKKTINKTRDFKKQVKQQDLFDSIFEKKLDEVQEKAEEANFIQKPVKELDLIHIEKPWENEEIYRYPVLKNLLRQQTEAEYKGLKEDISTRGCITPIIVWRNQEKYFIVDGYNRDRACRELKKDYFIRVEFFESEIDVKVFIIKHQLERRNLNDFERSKYALELKSLFREKARKNMSDGSKFKGVVEKITTLKEVSKLAGVSHDTIHRVESIEKNASPEVLHKIKNNELSINMAYEMSKLDKEDQKELAKLDKKDIIKVIETKKQEIKEKEPSFLQLPVNIFDPSKLETLIDFKKDLKEDLNDLIVLKDDELDKIADLKNKIISKIKSINDIKTLETIIDVLELD